MESHSIQIKLSNDRWYWVEWNDFDLEPGASHLINSDTAWFDNKIGAEEFIKECNIMPEVEIMVFKENSEIYYEKIVSVRIVKIQPVEV